MFHLSHLIHFTSLHLYFYTSLHHSSASNVAGSPKYGQILAFQLTLCNTQQTFMQNTSLNLYIGPSDDASK